jgi:chemotaxis protein MotB
MKVNRSKVTYEDDSGASNSAGWLITFNDLITLLMVFFVLWFAMSSMNVPQSREFVDSIHAALGQLKEGNIVRIRITEPVPSGKDTPNEPGISRNNDDQNSESSRRAADDLRKYPEVSVIQRPGKLLITISNGILFQNGMADLQPEGNQVLNKILQAVQNTTFNIRVEGHTDDSPIHGGQYPSNWDLSVARAVRVLKYFIDIGKIYPRRLSAVGYGASRPLYPNDSPANKEKNRRVEIVLEKTGS